MNEVIHHKRPQPRSLSVVLDQFETHLRQNNRSETTVNSYMRIARRFVEFVGNEPVDRITPELMRSFFEDLGESRHYRNRAASVIGHFMRFAALRLPASAGKQGAAVRPLDAKEIALRQRWSYDRVLQEKERADALVAVLARQLINNFLFLQSRLSGEPENIDEINRLTDECREVIEQNLPVFLKLSALGKNLGLLINERINR